MHRLRVGNSRQYVICECVLGCYVLFVLSMELIFGSFWLRAVLCAIAGMFVFSLDFIMHV
jgi:hypothetical protein